VTAVLPEEELRPAPDVLAVAPLRAGVHRDDDDVRGPRGLAHELLRRGDVCERLRPGIRREADEGDADAADLLHGDLSGADGPLETDARARDGHMAHSDRHETVHV